MHIGVIKRLLPNTFKNLTSPKRLSAGVLMFKTFLVF